MREDPHWQRAEFLIARGYIPKGTDVGKIASELRLLDEKKHQDSVTNSRDAVYGENVPLIDKLMDSKDPIEKRLINDEVTKRDLDHP